MTAVDVQCYKASPIDATVPRSVCTLPHAGNLGPCSRWSLRFNLSISFLAKHNSAMTDYFCGQRQSYAFANAVGIFSIWHDACYYLICGR